MGKFIKRLFVLAFVCGLLYGGSYMGVRSVTGRMVGDVANEMGVRDIKFTYDSVPGIKGKQAMWVFSYSGTRLTGARNARIYLTLSGHVIATAPKNLQDLIDQAAKSKQPS